MLLMVHVLLYTFMSLSQCSCVCVYLYSYLCHNQLKKHQSEDKESEVKTFCPVLTFWHPFKGLLGG